MQNNLSTNTGNKTKRNYRELIKDDSPHKNNIEEPKRKKLCSKKTVSVSKNSDVSSITSGTQTNKSSTSLKSFNKHKQTWDWEKYKQHESKMSSLRTVLRDIYGWNIMDEFNIFSSNIFLSLSIYKVDMVIFTADLDLHKDKFKELDGSIKKGEATSMTWIMDFFVKLKGKFAGLSLTKHTIWYCLRSLPHFYAFFKSPKAIAKFCSYTKKNMATIKTQVDDFLSSEKNPLTDDIEEFIKKFQEEKPKKKTVDEKTTSNEEEKPISDGSEKKI